MLGERFVLLGLARARAEWFRAVASWATSAAIPADFVKCVSSEELRAHLAGGRVFSAVLLDAGLPAVDRDLLAAARDAGAVPIVVESAAPDRDWHALGALAVLPTTFTRGQLLDVLAAHAAMVGGGDVSPVVGESTGAAADTLAPVVAVCGPGGTGASTAAIAVAQGLAAQPAGGPVLLADLCLRAEQAMLHDARDVVPGVQELVEAHRGRTPTRDEIHALTFQVVERGYHLLLGLRRARYWASIRPRAFAAGFASLRRAFGAVVCDVAADFESEESGGSADVEERNLMARTAVQQAAAVVAVGTPGVKGMHALVRLLADLDEAGVPQRRIVVAFNQAPRSPKARAALASTLGDLAAVGAAERAAPVFLPVRRVEEALHDGVALPAPLAPVLAGAVRATLGRAGVPAEDPQPEPERVVPGSLGSFNPEETVG